MNKKENILILGMGEIGYSILGLYENFENNYNIYYKDNKEIGNCLATNINEITDINIDILHVCIPYTNLFVENVSDIIIKHNVKITLIHSTIPIGVTRNVYTHTKCNIVHSPVIGIHPNLTKSIQTFKKIIGPLNEESGKQAVEHLSKINVSSILYSRPEESEVAKLFSTTYYGELIAFMQNVYERCKEQGLNFDEVYTKTNEIYNEGYEKLGISKVKRPILKYLSKGIGGHCIFENSILLEESGMEIPETSNIIHIGKSKEKGGTAFRQLKD